MRQYLDLALAQPSAALSSSTEWARERGEAGRTVRAGAPRLEACGSGGVGPRAPGLSLAVISGWRKLCILIQYCPCQSSSSTAGRTTVTVF